METKFATDAFFDNLGPLHIYGASLCSTVPDQIESAALAENDVDLSEYGEGLGTYTPALR